MSKMSLAILVLLMSLVMAVVIGEVGLRLAGITFPVFEIFDPLRGKILKPGKQGWYRAEGEGHISVNSYGFRDIEHTEQKPARTYRIAVLGDSYVEAREVQLEQTFWKRLEADLADCAALDGTEIEVLNFGISGYGTAQELLTLRHDVWPFSPDLVLTLFFAGNDVSDNDPAVAVGGERGAGGQTQPYFILKDGELRLKTGVLSLRPRYVWRRFLLSAIHYSRLLELVNQARRRLYVRRFTRTTNRVLIEPGLTTSTFAPPATTEERAAWDLTDALLGQLHREAAERKADFLLVTATASFQVEPNAARRQAVQQALQLSSLDYPEQRLTALGREKGFDVFTLVKAFQDYAESSQVYLHGFDNTRMGIGHWNDKGHALAADLIGRQICQRLVSEK